MSVWTARDQFLGLLHFAARVVIDVHIDMLNQFVFVYLNDNLIFSRNKKEHVIHVSSVLHNLLDNNLFVKAEKCEFHVYSVSFLGYIIAKDSLKVNTANVSAKPPRHS